MHERLWTVLPSPERDAIVHKTKLCKSPPDHNSHQHFKQPLWVRRIPRSVLWSQMGKCNPIRTKGENVSDLRGSNNPSNGILSGWSQDGAFLTILITSLLVHQISETFCSIFIYEMLICFSVFKTPWREILKCLFIKNWAKQSSPECSVLDWTFERKVQ